MPVSWINSFNSFSNYTVPILKDKILSYLDIQQKRIMAVVLVVLGSLVAFYVLYRCFCFKATKGNKIPAVLDSAEVLFREGNMRKSRNIRKSRMNIKGFWPVNSRTLTH